MSTVCAPCRRPGRPGGTGGSAHHCAAPPIGLRRGDHDGDGSGGAGRAAGRHHRDEDLPSGPDPRDGHGRAGNVGDRGPALQRRAVGDLAPAGTTTGTSALARWSLPKGLQRVAPLGVGANLHAGDRMSIWIDQHGNRTDPPETPGFVIANTAVLVVNVVIGGWVALGALWWIVCRVLSRINMARWDVQWAPHRTRWCRRTWQ